MIHVTHPTKVEAILREGLRTGLEPLLTSDAIWTVPRYGVNPVFLGDPDSDFIATLREHDWSDHPVIAVDVSGLELVADLACLIDKGATLDEDGYLFWTPRRMPDAMRPFCDYDGAIEIKHLLDPTTDACRAAIRLTGTAACLTDIPPERLTLLEPDAVPAP